MLYCGCCLHIVQCCTLDVACNLSNAALRMLPAYCPMLYLAIAQLLTHFKGIEETEVHLNQTNDRTVRRRDADIRTASGITSTRTRHPATIRPAITPDVTAASQPQYRSVASPIPRHDSTIMCVRDQFVPVHNTVR